MTGIMVFVRPVQIKAAQPDPLRRNGFAAVDRVNNFAIQNSLVHAAADKGFNLANSSAESSSLNPKDPSPYTPAVES